MIPLLRKRGKVFLLALVVLIVLEIVGGTSFKQRANDWKSFTGKDSDFGVQTTISLPPGCDFVFSGSEWDLNCGENEKWDYTNSVYRGNDERNPKNHYSGEFLQQWYQQYINQDKIISAKEHPINKGHYLEVQVKLADSGKMETNYVYVQNNIVHILRPLVIDELNSVVKKNIGIIFTSLKSNITK